MIAFYGCIAIALLLFGLLFLLGSGTAADALDAADGDSSAPTSEAACPTEVVKQVFSPQDFAFVARQRSPRLQHLFISERRRVAMGWIRRTSAELSLAMQEHVRMSRQKEDVEAATEAKVLLQYVRLRCLCGLLLASATVVRPSALQELAVYASELSRRLDAGKALAARELQVMPARIRPTN